jgi:hypothetical protein
VPVWGLRSAFADREGHFHHRLLTRTFDRGAWPCALLTLHRIDKLAYFRPPLVNIRQVLLLESPVDFELLLA